MAMSKEWHQSRDFERMQKQIEVLERKIRQLESWKSIQVEKEIAQQYANN
jgi:hypothetical protein